MMRHMRRRSGSTMVEMAIVLPVLVLILFAIIEFGIAFQRWQIVTNAAREGARAAVVRTGTCDSAYLESVVDQYVTVAGLTPAQVIVTHSDPCVAVGELVNVQVQHDFDFPVLAGLVPGLADGIPLTGRAIMRKE